MSNGDFCAPAQKGREAQRAFVCIRLLGFGVQCRRVGGLVF